MKREESGGMIRISKDKLRFNGGEVGVFVIR
jgi:hypothetical protein